MQKYKLIGFIPEKLAKVRSTPNVTASQLEPFERAIAKVTFPVTVEPVATAEIDDEAFPIMQLPHEFPYNEWSLAWFIYEKID